MLNNTLFFKIIKIVTIVTLAFFIINGVVMTIFELKPFWLDEWFIIHNLKNKTANELWGELDFMQQFPRLYLQGLKGISSIFNYNYFSLRLPSLLVHTTGVFFCYYLSGKIYQPKQIHRFLWVMIFVAYNTSLHYFVQTKQYTMEMLLSLLSIWQLISLVAIANASAKLNYRQYTLLCVSFIIAPFLSYTYPILAAPIIITIILCLLRSQGNHRRPFLFVPIFLVIVSTIIFYIVDVKHVLADKGMQQYWKEYMMTDGFSFSILIISLYRFFANLGAGSLFEIIFFVLGIAGWIYGTVVSVRNVINKKELSIENALQVYSSLLVWLIFFLFLIGKLPLGPDRLNAFAVSAIGILITFLLRFPTENKKVYFSISIFTVALTLASAGNVFATYINEYTGTEQAKKKKIYNNLALGISISYSKNCPIYAASGIAYPYSEQIKGDWVLKTHPGYNVKKPLAVYPVVNTEHAIACMRQLHVKQGVYVDIDTVRILSSN